MICPNLSNPQIKQEFNELKDAVGEALAYHLWNLNQGHPLDRAPNGNPSQLYKQIEDLVGNRTDAMKLKARVHTDSFKEWFGNSKVVDKNNEPLLRKENDTLVLTSEEGDTMVVFNTEDSNLLSPFQQTINSEKNRQELASSTDNLYEEWESIFPDFAYLNPTEKRAAIELIEQGFFQITC